MTEASASISSDEPVEVAIDGAVDDDRYMLRSRVEIAYVLRSLARNASVVRVRCGRGADDVLLTTLLGVDSESAEIAFEATGSEHLNRRIVQSERLTFVSEPDKVRIQFSTAGAQPRRIEGRDAFVTPLPDEVLRLQRREYYRMVTPIARPVACTVPLVGEDGGRQLVEARLQDISLGGVGLALGPDGPGLESGKEYPNCRLVLPDAGNVVVTLAVRHAFTLTMLNGKTSRRYGCMFARPSASALSLVQRYILKLERARRAAE